MRYINKADVEFYHGGMVMVVARTLPQKPYDELSHRSKQRVLNKAVDIVHALLNDPLVQEKIRLYVSQLR